MTVRLLIWIITKDSKIFKNDEIDYCGKRVLSLIKLQLIMNVRILAGNKKYSSAGYPPTPPKSIQEPFFCSSLPLSS